MKHSASQRPDSPWSYAPSEGYFTGSLRGELGIRKLIFSNVVRFTATGVCTVNNYYVFSLLVSLNQSFLEAKLPLAAPLVGRVKLGHPLLAQLDDRIIFSA